MTPIATPKAASRRSFLSRLAAALGGLASAIVATPAIAAILFPATHKTVEEQEGYLDVAALENLEVGTPSIVSVTATRRDAWSRVNGVELGTVWLTRSADGKVSALSSVCPHLGCAVDFLPETKSYSCPCHASVFDVSGAVRSGPSPRRLDSLDAKVEGGRVLVRFQRFAIGSAEKGEG